jgi:Xaa-Pro aminopeptidase
MPVNDYMQPDEYLARLRASPIAAESAFPEEEYRGRIERVRAEMARRDLDALIVCMPANLNYLVGYDTFGIDNFTCVLLPADGQIAACTVSSEIPSIALCAPWVDDLSVFPWPFQTGASPLLVEKLAQRGLLGKRVGIELERGGPVPLIFAELKSLCPGTEIIDGSGVFGPVKVVKTERELDVMRTAGKITAAAVKAALQSIRPGMTDNEVAAAGYRALIAGGSEFMSLHPIVSAGERIGYHHTSFRRNRLEVGDPVFFEYGARYYSYHAPMMRTAIIGEPSTEQRRIAEAVKTTVALVIENARAGRSARDVAMAAYKGFAGLRDEVWFMGVYGYSVGAGFPPNWADCPFFIHEDIEEPLVAGMTFHLPIVFRLPRKFGIGLSETIAITETDCEVLTEPERDIFIAPTE